MSKATKATPTTALHRREAAHVTAERRHALDSDTLEASRRIVEDVRRRGERALREHAERLGDLKAREPMIHTPSDLDSARKALPKAQRDLLERTADRVRAFALAQRKMLGALTTGVPGGFAGHHVEPVETAGCYAPGGRFPLPSSVLMTAVTARAAGVSTVWVASPRPTLATLAAAAIAGADALLAVGGPQAVAALAYGTDRIPACDVLVGPGNRWVTAAKQLVAGHVAIDMLAGPSELLVLADASAEAGVIAADLLAQAEHDPDALPLLVTTDAALALAVDRELEAQLQTLPTAETARQSLANGGAVVCDSLEDAIDMCNRVGPEHLEVMVRNPDEVVPQLKHYGGLFIGHGSAEVFGDYGAGPNHVLPTGGTARYSGGLSVFTFLRVRTWLRMDHGETPAAQALARDAAALARLEGLEAHARAAERRLPATAPVKRRKRQAL
jgi:phosphoribosyl-ATP pyrophosphohydrolase/phosphoribosyl-AMP cyclohydrolase/histidinol dehydrogenase